MSLSNLGTFALQCLGNNLFLGAGSEPKNPLTAVYANPDHNTHFRLDAVGHGDLKFYCYYHQSHISGYGYSERRGKPGPGWALRPGVADEPWSRFAVQVQGTDPSGLIIQIRSTSPAAAGTPWVQIIGQQRLGAISKPVPELPWAHFRVVSVAE